MVGLCVALAAAAGYETTTGYAIPVDATFRRALDTLKEGREVQYGFLGIQPANLGPNEALSGVHGMRVDGVMPGTPAARFGLKTDDVITDVDQTPLYDADGLVLAVGKQPVESVTRLSILRDGQRRTIDVTLGKYPVQGTKIVTVKPEAWRGMRVDYASTAADPRQPLHSGMAFFDEAVAVSEVAEGTAAWRAGLRPGMFVSQVDGLPVRTPKEFEAAVARKAGTVEFAWPWTSPTRCGRLRRDEVLLISQPLGLSPRLGSSTHPPGSTQRLARRGSAPRSLRRRGHSGGGVWLAVPR